MSNNSEHVSRALGVLLKGAREPEPELSREARVAVLRECVGNITSPAVKYQPNDLVDFHPYLSTLDVPGPFIVVNHGEAEPMREGVSPGSEEYVARFDLKVGFIADGSYHELLIDSSRVHKVEA